MAYDFDLFVIGGGSGGVRAARIAAQSGAKVGIAEEYRMGGTCVIRGCVPKKLMVYASGFKKGFKDAEGFGWSIGDTSYDHSKCMTAIADEVSRLSGIYMSGQKNAGVEVFEERAELTGPNGVRLVSSGRDISAERILVATGGTPWRPSEAELPGVERTITSNEVFDLRELPEHIVIAGGGYIAVEFAHVFAGLGAETTLVYRKDLVLRGFDMDVREKVQADLAAAGVNVVTNTVFASITDSGVSGRPHKVTLTNGDTLDASVIMMAVGRRPNTSGLGCEAAGVDLGEGGEIKVDAHSRTNVASIWAVGDVTDRVQLTPVAIREGHAFADTEFNNNPWSMDHDDIPTAVFTQPEVGTVGLSEDIAREKFGDDVDIYRASFRPMKNTISGRETRVLMKLVVRASDDRMLGVHIVSPDAAEMIQTAGIAVKMGATKADFDRTCALHPSTAEELVTMRDKVT
ncbi:MAG: glutathione-disulfide reductase [Pseudomonadota bacterium]